LAAGPVGPFKKKIGP